MLYSLKLSMPLKTSKIMESKIIHTIQEWFPWAKELDNDTSEYALLRDLANYCREKIQKEELSNASEVIKVINLLYSSGSLHVKNAIENEFLEVLTTDEAPATLKEHLKILPKELKEAYLKTILEN